ncbi:MAG: response regulator [Chitinophagaceae bacterium]|nr:response regulator [Anaerolineae bacterium]
MATVLVVEDDLLNLELFKSFLSHMGYEVITATTGQKGIDLARKHFPEMILVDWRLPGGMDGLQAVQFIKKDPTTAHIPVILTTAHCRQGDEERIYAAGCQGCIPKPFNLNTLKEAIGAVLSTA